LRLSTNGAKRITEAMACIKRDLDTWVGERSLIDTSLTVRTGVVDQRSENVGMSNEKIGEIPVRRKFEVSVRTVHPLRVSRHLSRGQLE
jgi:hypothetical protein